MDIYILRHGKAEEAGPGRSDADRRLTKKGRDEIHAVAHWIAGQEIPFDLIASSPLARAQETAAIVAGILGCTGAMTTWKALVPGGSPDTLCAGFGRYPDEFSILVVGHEPLLSSLIGRICCGDTNAGIAMTRGSLAKIRNYSYDRRPSGELHWLLTAKQMAGRN